MGNTKTPEELLRETGGYLDGLIRFFAVYEFSDAVKNIILPQLKQARARVIELGEVITNDPQNKAAKDKIAELQASTTALTGQLIRMASEMDTKDAEIKTLKAQIKELKNPKKPE